MNAAHGSEDPSADNGFAPRSAESGWNRQFAVLLGVSLALATAVSAALMVVRDRSGLAEEEKPGMAGFELPALQPRIFANARSASFNAMQASSDGGPPVTTTPAQAALAFPLERNVVAAIRSGSGPGAPSIGTTPAPIDTDDALMVDTPAAAARHTEASAARVVRAERGQQSLLLAAGSSIACALETAIDSSRAGFVTCTVTHDVVSEDARTVLIERGTHALGEYRADTKLGDSRIGIVWNRLRKSDGTTVDLASPGIDQQGRAGLPGAVDNHWGSRIGAAVLLSVIEDGVSAATLPRSGSGTIVFGNTATTGTNLSQKVLDASINIAPTISVNAGTRIDILVARDLDFGGVYANR